MTFLPKYLWVHSLACFCLFDLSSLFSIAGGELFERIIDDDYILTGNNQHKLYHFQVDMIDVFDLPCKISYIFSTQYSASNALVIHKVHTQFYFSQLGYFLDQIHAFL